MNRRPYLVSQSPKIGRQNLVTVVAVFQAPTKVDAIRQAVESDKFFPKSKDFKKITAEPLEIGRVWRL